MQLLCGSESVSQKILSIISFLDEFKGKWIAASWLKPESLGTLKRSTIISSSGSSTRIEGAKLTDAEIRNLLGGLKIKKISSRDQQEVKGYSDLLETIFDRYSAMPLTENTIQSLHKMMLDYVDEAQRHKGLYKKLPNHVSAYDARSGKEIGVLLETVAPALTPIDMQKLVAAYADAIENKIHPLIALAEFVIRFLHIHPFQDGNGRLSRALTNLALMQSGYTFSQYVSHEKFIEDNKDRYYLELNQGQKKLAKNKFPEKWVEFFLELIKHQVEYLADTIQLEQELQTMNQREKEILDLLTQLGKVTNQIVHERLGYSPNTLKTDFRNLVARGKLNQHGTRKGTYYTAG